MKISKPGIAALVLSAFLTTPAIYAAQPHQHEHGGSAGTQLQLDNGRKWNTDAPLRRGMGAIRTLIDKAPHALHDGAGKPEAYAALGARIEAETAKVIAECKLEPRADAMLHLVIADLLAGAETLKQPQPGQGPRDGLLKVAKALDDYGKFFQHPGWKPLGH